MKILALDTSKRSTGWALWQPGWDAPRFGSQQLGSEFTSDGQCCLKLHRLMADLRATICKFEIVYIEQPLTQLERGGNSNPANDVQLKLVGHAESFAAAMRMRCQLINVKSWARHFIGAMPRGTKSKEKKEYTIERCQQFGWKPRNSDEADACGLADYAIHISGLTPPWRIENALLPALGARA